MNIRKIQARYLWLRLVEARKVVFVGVLMAVGCAGLLFCFAGRTGSSGDLYWHPAAQDPDTICNTYGESTVCFPATEGVKRYRREQKARREASPGG